MADVPFEMWGRPDETDSAFDARWLLRFQWRDDVLKVWPVGTFKQADKPDPKLYLFRLGSSDDGVWAFWCRDMLRLGFPTRAAARVSATVRLRACLDADASGVHYIAAYDVHGLQAVTLRDKSNDLRRIAARSYRGNRYRA